MTHTPGPWTITGPSPGNQIRNMDDGGDYAIVNDGKIIAEAFHRVGETRYEDAKANARLIAAAPRLLTALEHIQTWYESNATDDDCPICRYEPPHHHGQCPKELAEQALAAAKEGE